MTVCVKKEVVLCASSGQGTEKPRTDPWRPEVLLRQRSRLDERTALAGRCDSEERLRDSQASDGKGNATLSYYTA